MEEEIKRMKEINDRYDKIYNEKYADKNLHDKPSPETLKMLGNQEKQITNLEANQKNFMDKLETSIQDNKEAQKNNREDHLRIFDSIEKIDQKLTDALEKKADKAVVERIQNNIQWVVYTVIGAVILAVIGLIIKQ